MRFLSWLLVRSLYRLRTRGIDNIPDDGPALVVCNHVSYMDALILSASIPRPVRFVMYRSEEHTSELQSLMRISYAVFCLKKKKDTHTSMHNIRLYVTLTAASTQF